MLSDGGKLELVDKFCYLGDFVSELLWLSGMSARMRTQKVLGSSPGSGTTKVIGVNSIQPEYSLSLSE